ncbi:ABC transporter substrate-binding protein [Miltoncostaea oceani]|uniref:ABC transporter substrate-binding protein n=1 Tax=Miltoncostaea oceani TaxID=2843216 RepID=UPI001C3CF1FE|nr:ABC transporter substrate-binding protein [Miltoncostaea oceani]
MRHIPSAAAVVAALVCALPAAAAGGTLVVAAAEDPDSLDPAIAYDTESWQVLVNAGEGLVAYRHAAGAAGAEVVPALAQAMPSVSADGRRLVFRVRRDARFGPPANRAVRPSDLKASIERLFLAGSPGRGLFRSIAGATRFEATRSGGIPGLVARDGARTLEVRLVRSDPAILRVLALPFAFALPAGTPATPQAGPGLASAGPYRVAAYTPGAGIELARNPGYAPGAATRGAAGPDAISVRLGLSPEEGAALVRGGRADYVQPRPSGDDVAAAAASPAARVRRHVEGTTYYFFMNTRRAPFDDVRVRRAVGLAIDRAALAKAFEGQAVPTAQVLPPGVPGRRVTPAAPAPDVAAARRLVAQAGATGAYVTVWGQTNTPSPDVTARLARTLDAIGLRATSRLWERTTLLATLADPAAPSQIGYARWRQDYPDAADWFPLLLSGDGIRPGATLNYALLDDDALDRRIAAAAATWDDATRARRWQGVEAAVARRAAWAPFANTVRRDIVSRRVAGYVPHQVYGFLWMRARVP